MRLALLFKALRARFLTASIISVLLGTSVAYYETDSIDIVDFILALFIVAFLHCGANLINDYFDYTSECDKANTTYIHPYTGGSRLIQKELARPETIKVLALLFFTLALGIGVYFFLKFGWIVLLVLLIGIVTSYFYTTFFSSRGLGEFIIFINFGMLATLASFYVQTRSITLPAVTAAAIIGLFVVNILLANGFPDYDADKSVGKKTLVVRLHFKKAAYVYLIFYLIAYALLAIAVAARTFPPFCASALVTLPIAVRSFFHLKSGIREGVKKGIVLTIANHTLTGILLIAGFVFSALLLR